MKILTSYIRQSLSKRLSLWIVVFATIIFVAALGFMFVESRRAVREEAISHASQILESTVLRINGIMDRVEVATNNTDWLVTRHLDAPDSMFVYSRRILQNNPFLNGCSIAFEPHFFKDRGRFFSAYSNNENGVIQTTQEGNEKYVYFYMDWYQLCKLLDRPCWTEPFLDFNPQDISSAEMICSYCKPLKNSSGEYVGTISVDLSLSWLSKTISSVKPYPHSYSIMIGQGGTFFVHPDTTKLFFQTIFTETLEHPDTTLTALGHAMQRGEEGMRQLTLDNEDCYVFYKPLGKTGWSVAIVCHESDIFGGYNRLQRYVIGIVIAGLLLMLFFFSRIIARELKPLRQLAQEAETIASGQFDAELPDFKRIDEIGHLSQSFGHMQKSLVDYIKELKTTTAQKASIESELNVANSIQMSMLPNVFPDREGLDMYASMTPAKEVGGDLYGYLLIGDKLYFCVGDVSGKGVPASLFMAQVTRLFRTLAVQQMQPAEICTRMNNALSGDENLTNMFVTLFIGLVELQTGHLMFCNAGHNPPVIGGGEHHGEFLKMFSNYPIGIFPDLDFQGEEIDSIKGCPLFIYTDGLNEAENLEHDQFGDDRLLNILRNTHFDSARQVIETLAIEVENHRNGADPNDDLTMMCLRVN
jgi:sigma-B regulation protein RsbU (phosphoserine phosphatase)